MNKFSILLFVMILTILSCNGDDSTGPGPTTNLVIIKDNFFDPATTTVSVGRPVFWRQEGSVVHTVTSGTPTSNTGGIFDSGNLKPGSGFQFTFSGPGSYPYFCRIHGVGMSGTIVVR